MTQQKVFFKNSRGQKLAGILHRPAKGRNRLQNNKTGNLFPSKAGLFPAVIFAHGFRGRCKDGPKPVASAKALVERGFVFLRFDFSNIGESEGKFEDTTITQYVDDLKCAVDFVSGLDFIDREKISLVGSSMGGLVSIISASNDKRIKSLVLMCPITGFNFMLGETKQRFDESKEKGYTSFYIAANKKEERLNYSFYRDMLTYDALDLARKIAVPTLVIHGEQDKTVSIDGSRLFLKNLKNGRLKTVKSADHRFEKPEEFEKLIKLTVDWIEKHGR